MVEFLLIVSFIMAIVGAAGGLVASGAPWFVWLFFAAAVCFFVGMIAYDREI